MVTKKRFLFFLFIGVTLSLVYSQPVSKTDSTQKEEIKEMKLKLNESGSHYVKATFLNQVWMRMADYNPGSQVFGYNKASGFDIGLRRTRLQLFGQLTDHVFFYFQFGQNNFNNVSERKTGAFIHDALTEYQFNKKIALGVGLTGWNGLSRFSSPSVGSIMGVDAPLFLQATNDATDQFLRKLSVYAKGKIEKLDYRIALSTPMAIQNSSTNTAISKNANFNTQPANPQLHGYVMYQFKDQESNLMPYNAGSYLGSKSVFNIGFGALYQQNGMRYLNSKNDTVLQNILLLGVDVFYDAPLKDNGSAISVYGGYYNYDFGKNYIRNVGPMNPTTSVNPKDATANGSGVGVPIIGTGNIGYIQVGYKTKDGFLMKKGIMPYVSCQTAKYQKYKDQMFYYDAGVNFLFNGHTSKLTLAYQNRPIFKQDANKDYIVSQRKGAMILQYQISF